MKKIQWLNPKKLNPDVTFAKIREVAQPKDNSSLSIKNFSYFEYLGIIQSQLKFPELNEEVGEDWVVRNAVTKGLHTNQLDKVGFLLIANQILEEALAKPEKTFHLLTSISTNRSFPFRNTTVNECKIRFFEKDYPKKYKGRCKAIESISPTLESAHKGYLKCIVTVKAKYPAAATHRALFALDYLRATFCLFGNPNIEFNWGNAEGKPINILRLGQTHTLHDERGLALLDTVWYDPNFYYSFPVKMHHADIHEANFLEIQSKLSGSLLGKQLAASLVKYVRACDQKDSNTTMVKLWSVMESTLSPQNASHEKVVARGAALYPDRLFHEHALDHLRRFRNRSVHEGEDSDQSKAYCYQLQRYFKRLIEFHLSMFPFFQSLDQANEFLDLPVDEQRIREKIAMLEKALEIRYGLRTPANSEDQR